MEEIIDHVHYEIKSSGFEKKLIGGIVVTGGGSLLKHLPQLIEYVTGLDCRLGYPNEHLAKNESLPKNIYEDLKSPMYATGIGLLIKGIERVEIDMQKDNYKERKVEVITETNQRKNRGLFASLLEGTKKFIKDDISDQDFLK
jgi:cell division protein FtsA